MPTIYEHRFTVQPESIDRQGHVNNLEYVRWMQDAAVSHSTAQGWDAQRYEQLGGGWVVRSHQIEYLRPAFEGDQLILYTWVANFRKIRSLRRYKFVRPADEAVLATAATDWAFIDYQKRQPRRVPEEVASAFVIVADDEAATATSGTSSP